MRYSDRVAVTTDLRKPEEHCMGWGRMDDGFDDHPKVVALLDHDDLAVAGVAIGMWTLAFTWAHRNTRKQGKTPGLIPAGLPRRWFGPDLSRAAAALLVRHRLWDEHPDGGWLIHDFADYLPTESTRDARSEAGKRGAAARWGARQAVPDAGITPDSDGKLPSACHSGAGNDEASDGSRARVPTPIPVPTPVPLDLPSEAPDPSSPAGAKDEPKREDVEKICADLAKLIVKNGNRTPTITKRWRTEARLLIDRDKRTLTEICDVIRWCQQDTFWKTNILSMPKLREKYDQLRGRMEQDRDQQGRRNGNLTGGHQPYRDPRRDNTEDELRDMYSGRI